MSELGGLLMHTGDIKLVYLCALEILYYSFTKTCSSVVGGSICDASGCG